MTNPPFQVTKFTFDAKAYNIMAYTYLADTIMKYSSKGISGELLTEKMMGYRSKLTPNMTDKQLSFDLASVFLSL